MAAEVISAAGHTVVLVDQMPSLGRKFLMAGKSGLNITKDVDLSGLLSAIQPAGPQLTTALTGFDAAAVQEWAVGLGQPVFTGSSGRVFPKTMKTSPLLRAILARLQAAGVQARTRWRWTGWNGDALTFDTPDGPQSLTPRATVLALGGASWARLGSDGRWADHLPIEEFRPANMGFTVNWSPYMERFFGQPVKQVRLSHNADNVLGEFVVSRKGVEGSAIYAMSSALRDAMTTKGVTLTLDLFPDRSREDLSAKLARPRGKTSFSNHLRKSIGLDGVKAALLRECTGSKVPPAPELAALIKALPLHLQQARPMDEAISTGGGVRLADLDASLMLTARPGTFVAGEMLDWEAPTGGYLITTCLATGRLAGQGAVRLLDQKA